MRSQKWFSGVTIASIADDAERHAQQIEVFMRRIAPNQLCAMQGPSAELGDHARKRCENSLEATSRGTHCLNALRSETINGNMMGSL